MNSFTVRTKCYLDSFAGLIPCVVTQVKIEAAGNLMFGPEIQIKLTANRQSYRRGEILMWPASHVIPRGHVRVKNGHFLINSDYKFVPSIGGEK